MVLMYMVDVHRFFEWLAHCMVLMYMGVVHGWHTIWYMFYLVDVLIMILYFIVDIYFSS